MNNANNRRLYAYSSLFIALMLNVPKLFALRRTGIVAQYWHFDAAELALQSLISFLFCYGVFWANTREADVLSGASPLQKRLITIGPTVGLLALFAVLGIFLQKKLFAAGFLYGGGTLIRLISSFVLILIELKILRLMQTARDKEIENEHLRNAYLKTELEVLKGQLDPHFFFNALSSLSAVVRENPQLAQQYINHLSKVYRYPLNQPANNMSTLKEEIDAAQSFAQLMKMRHEDGFEITFTIDDTKLRSRLPHMSLQPLIENALKHNTASASKPLRITVATGPRYIEVRNNLQPLSFPEPGSGIGLANLMERYRILMKQDISITKTTHLFIVQLPLQ